MPVSETYVPTSWRDYEEGEPRTAITAAALQLAETRVASFAKDLVANIREETAAESASYRGRKNILGAGVKNDGRVVYDAAMTSGTTTITSATAAFTGADVGRAFRISGAGTSGTGVYGTITVIVSATQVTVANLNAVTTTVSGARLEMGTDNTAAVQAAWDQGGQWWWPDGRYCFLGRTTSGGVPACLYLGAKDNVGNLGAPGSVLSMLRDDSALVKVTGVEKLVAAGTVLRSVEDSSTNRFYAQPTYSMAAVAKNDMTLTLNGPTAAADAALFKRDDLIVMRGGQCITSPSINAEPDAEYNRVKSVSGTTITLERPAGKAFAQEYQHAFNQVSRLATKPSVRTAIASGVTAIPVDSRLGLKNGQVIGIGQGGTWESRTISVEPVLGNTSITVSVATTSAHAAGEPISATWLNGAHTAGDTTITLNTAHADLKAGYKLHIGWGATQETVTVTGAPTGNVVPTTAIVNSYADHDPVSIGTLLGVMRVEPYTVKNIVFESLGFYMPDTATNRTCIVVRGGVSGLTIRECRFNLSHHLTDAIEYHLGKFENNVVHFRAPVGASTYAWPFLGATGVTDVDIVGNHVTAEGRLTGWHMHEGCTRVMIRGNTIVQPDGQPQQIPIYDCYARQHDLHAYGNTYIGGNLYAIVDEGSERGSGVIRGDIFRTSSVGTSAGYHSIIYVPGYRIEDPDGTNGLITGIMKPIASSEVWGQERMLGPIVVRWDDPTIDLGWVPRNAYITERGILVTTAFNAGTNDNIRIGYEPSATTYYTGDTDVSTTGRKTATIGLLGDVPTAAPQFAKVYYQQTGTPATAGQATVWLKYVIVPQQ